MAKKFLSQIEMNVAPTADDHVVTLGVLEARLNGTLKSPVRAATTANLAAAYEGTGKTLTAGANGALAVDGVTLLAGDRVLVKDQTDKTQNGIYVVTATGDASNPFVLTRASDFDQSAELVKGVVINVAAGTSNKGQWGLVYSSSALVLDSSNIEFERVTQSEKAVKAAFDITGDGTTAQFDFAHSFGTKDVIFGLYDAATGEEVMADIIRTSLNDARVVFGEAPAAGENYRLVVITVVNNA
jgi:hypothetical protein